MLRSHSFWSLFGSYAVLVLLAASTLGTLSVRELHRTLDEQTDRYLEAQCALLAPLAKNDFAGLDLEQVGPDLATIAAANGVRLTLIRRDGEVLLDTDHPAGEMQNHLGRPEVQGALRGGYDRNERESVTIGLPHIYKAYVQDADRSGVVRVSQSTAAAERRIQRAVGTTLRGTGLVALIALALGSFVARRLTRPLAEITKAALAYEGGDFEFRINPVPKGDLGTLARTFNRMGSETSSRVRLLEKDEGQLRAMLAGMREGVLAVDVEDRVSFTNAAARELFNLNHDHPDGQRIWELVRVPGLQALLDQARSTDAAARAELVLARDGIERTLLSKANRFVTQEQIGVVLVFSDVTELRHLERVRRDFVANVSHELKTPLTSIRGYVETLMDGALHDAQNNMRFLGKIDTNVQRLGALVSDLLSLARIEEREDELVLTTVELRPLVDGAVRRSEEAAQQKDITVSVEMSAESCVVQADEEAMLQVLDNLLGNAIHYTPQGGSVRICVELIEAKTHITVSDTGVGIPAEDLDRIFERFYRVDKARSRSLGGTGLGLSIVKHLVGAMGGEVTVRSTLGTGSVFDVELVTELQA
ncbi:MAG: two-component system phosphate regulon sensor histidine kinase PhoR [Planctomycetota bacterium]|jgi:two-component system phosphate regulon sensor histidine kinase PhoR